MSLGKKIILSIGVCCMVGILLGFSVAPAFSAVTWKIKHATYAPSSHVYTRVAETFAKRVSEATDGKVEINVYPNAALCAGSDQFTSVSMGSVDMTDLISDYMVGQVDMLGMGSLPFGYDCDKAYLVGEDARDLIANRLDKENVVYLYSFTLADNLLYVSDTAKKTMNDFQGMKTRASGVYPILLLEEAGLVPVRMSTGDIFMAVETKMIEAASTGPLSWSANTLYEVLPIIHMVPVAPAMSFVAINKDVFTSMPNDIQDTILRVAKEFAPIGNQMVVDEKNSILNKAVEEWNCTLVKPSAEELQKWVDVASKIREKVINEGAEEAAAMWEIMQKYPVE